MIFICLVTINEYLNAIVLVFSPLSSSSSSFHTHLCCRGRLHCSFFSRLFYLLRLSSLPSLIVFGGGIVMALLSCRLPPRFVFCFLYSFRSLLSCFFFFSLLMRYPANRLPVGFNASYPSIVQDKRGDREQSGDGRVCIFLSESLI